MKEFSQDELTSLAYELPAEVLKYKMCGDFSGASEAIDRWLEQPVAEALKTRMRLEKRMLEQLPGEFPYTESQVIALMREHVSDFSREDLERLDREGMAEWIYLNGEKHYIHNLVRNVINKDAEIMQRAGMRSVEDEEKRLLKETIQEMKQKGETSWRFRVRSSIRLRDEFFHPGIHLKVHLPIPAGLYQISDVNIIGFSDCKVSVDREDSLYRAICFEETMKENHEFFVEYEYTVHAVYHDFSRQDQEELRKSFTEISTEEYRKEQYPHIRFSPCLCALAAEIVGDEKEPLLMARKIYDYITTKVHYSFMREYFLIPDIPQYCARNLRGDCGVQALLFITLCRILKIPAKWQSGLYAIPGSVGPHDWAMFWIEPYGWLFADPSFGGSAFRDGDEERRSFYFGNLDPFRMVSNNAFQQSFSCAKRFQPIDPYDNQTGEMESEERGYGKGEVETTRTMLFGRPL